MLVAGEASGDLHGSEIARYVRAANPDIRCVGMGSNRMRNNGVELLYDSAGIAVVGLWEVLTHWNEIKRALHKLEQYIVDNRPDLLLLIDYQEFNLRLAGFARRHGVKVLFYISPQLWAWRRGRIKRFVHNVDMMAVIFPFEVDYFEQAGIPVRYTGHPLSGKVKATLDKNTARTQFGLRSDQPVIGLLPGSRRSEIQRILPILLASAERLQQRFPEIQFVLPAAGDNLIPRIEDALKQSKANVKLCTNQTYNAVNCCDAAIVASGTATLEVALLNVPMAVVYRVAPLSYAILRRMLSIPYVALANIVAGREVAREFIQHQAQPERIAAEISELISNPDYNRRTRENLQQVKDNLGETDGIEGISRLALDMLLAEDTL